jgi:hypothetical protein
MSLKIITSTTIGTGTGKKTSSIVLAAAPVLLLVIAAAVAGLLTFALSGVASAVGLQDQRSISDPNERSIGDPNQFVLRR